MCQMAHKTTKSTVMIVSIHKNTPEGRALTAAAELVGIDPADLLSGICINATRRARHATTPVANTPAQPTPTPTPAPAPTAAPSAGLFDFQA